MFTVNILYVILKPLEETLSIWTDGTDLGSIEDAGGSGDSRYNFQLFSADIAKLPTDVAGGSTAFVIDTDEIYVFHRQTKSWNKI